jgi:hypothetical protein
MRVAVTRQESFTDFPVPTEQPWKAFFDWFSNHGHNLVSINDDPDAIIFMNHHREFGIRTFKARRKALKVLVLWESVVTRPSNFKQNNLTRYKLIFAPSNNWVTGTNVFPFNWPQGKQVVMHVSEADFKARDARVAVFQNNKISFIEGEKYTLRRELIEVFGKDMVVYGTGWNNATTIVKGLLGATKDYARSKRRMNLSSLDNLWIQPKNYRGFVPDKHGELEKFQFTIVVENSLDYVSEKLIEALWAGCCVIYVGPPLSEFGIPKVAIECRPDSRIIRECYEAAQKDYSIVKDIQDNVQNYLGSKEFEETINNFVLEKLAADIMHQIKLLTVDN